MTEFKWLIPLKDMKWNDDFDVKTIYRDGLGNIKELFGFAKGSAICWDNVICYTSRPHNPYKMLLKAVEDFIENPYSDSDELEKLKMVFVDVKEMIGEK